MSVPCRNAGPEDVVSLVEMMTAFYQESNLPLDRQRAVRAFDALIADPALGRVYIIQSGLQPVGYMVLTLGYSMEYGGRDAFLDDLYIGPEHRGAGLGAAALAHLFKACDRLGVRAVHLEVDRKNAAAKALYARFGFQDNDRQLLTRRLKAPL